MEDKTNNSDPETFRYTYSAKQQEEVKRIRQKYLPPEADKLEQLRKLDQSATNRATMIAVSVGVLCTLVFGVGLCCILVWTRFFALGVVVSGIGMAGMGLALPLFHHITRKERAKLAPKILKISDELLHQ